MKNGPLLFLGLFGAFAISWAGFALGPSRQLGELVPYFDVATDKAYPEAASGLAVRGQQVYHDLGCVACHTQQVRRADFGSDIERKWGTRQSWARDYIFNSHVELGSIRIGPDLANVGARLKSADDVYRMLYAGTDSMPAYAFLFEERPANAQASAHAVGRVDGREIVPSRRAEALVAYLMSLNSPGSYAPEIANNAVKEAHKAEHNEGAKK